MSAITHDMLGATLRVPTATIGRIKQDHPDAATRTLKIFQAWKVRNKNRGNPSAMCTELRECFMEHDEVEMLDEVDKFEKGE